MKNTCQSLWASHTRGCASKIKDTLNKNFNVIGFVNPGSNTLTLANSAKETIGNLMFQYSGEGDTNDIRKNNAKEELKQILKFVKENKSYQHYSDMHSSQV